MADDRDGDEWQVFSRKKGGKSKQKQAAVLDHSPITSPVKSESGSLLKDCLQLVREIEDLVLPDLGSPLMSSAGSNASTKDTGDDHVSLLNSPSMESSWSDTSTEIPLAVLDESVLTEESCSLQPSSSGASLDGTASFDVKPPRISDGLSQAIRRCHESEGDANTHTVNANVQSFDLFGKTWTVPQKTQRRKRASWAVLAGIVACKGQQIGKSCRDNGNIVDSSCASDTAKAHAVPPRQSSRMTEPQSKKLAGSASDPFSIPPTWEHNGRRDEAAEWRLTVFQPLWVCSEPDIPHVPVSIKSLDGGMRLVIKQTFLKLEPTLDMVSCHPRRAHSLDTSLRGKRVAR